MASTSAPKKSEGQPTYASQVGINHATHPPHQITPEQLAKHKDSKAKYPQLPLSQGEYVIEEVRRHPIGILSIWFITILLIGVAFAAVALYGMNRDYIAGLFMVVPDTLPSAAILTVPALILSAFFALGGIIATIVYEGNRFYITNESIVQLLQPSLFNTKQQVVNLINVEDASSEQVNIIEQILNYGTIHLSTQGEQTRYQFRFVANPKRVTQSVNDAAERAVRVLQGYPIGEF
ncbi:MAG TPA: PH domain-containing protein [Candidatus Saccharimonadales bacterium]|nr:PH domain-containing protein [Candidatus Saccharimonadales bacterium]